MQKPTPKKASDHPEYTEEITHLDNVVGFIKDELRVNNPNNARYNQIWEIYGGADEHTAMVFHQQALDEWNELRKLADSPYFGRMDFIENNHPLQTYYIGYRGINLGKFKIVDWRAPIGSLFSRKSAGPMVKVSYLAPQGVTWGQLILKRHLKIELSTLEEILDELDWRSNRPTQETVVSSEEILIRQLFTRGDPHLQDIVKTIQEEQDQIIRSPANCAMVINGVAGSGKTSIAYHRVAYLLYPDTKANIQASKTIVFGPNRLFMSYVRELLPTLGVRSVKQVSFDDWALERMGLIEKRFAKEGRKDTPAIEYSRKYHVQDTSINILVNGQAERDLRIAHWKRARLKGGGKFKKLLENYLEAQRNAVRISNSDLIFNDLGQEKLSLTVPKNEVQQIYKDALKQSLPLEKLRDLVFAKLRDLLISQQNFEAAVNQEYSRRIKNHVLIEGANQFRNRVFTVPFFQREVNEKAVSLLKKELDNRWPRVDLRNDYYRLLSNSAKLMEYGKNILSTDDIRLLSSSIPDAGIIDIEDIPALLYFYILLHGKGDLVYDHIVIDEAQDFSPLQFQLLQMYNSNTSFTIVGDLAQGIYAHRGIADWNEVRSLFKSEDFVYKEIDQNYRSTGEIVAFSNEVLKKIGKGKLIPARPFNRSGDIPVVSQVTQKTDLYRKLNVEIVLLLAKGFQNIGIIAKTEVECYSVARQITAITELNKILTRDSDYDYQGGVCILPAALAKGLEFEAVIVVNASEANYNSTVEYDGRVLYVAITRALHYLSIYSVGKVTGFLDSALQKARFMEYA